MPDKQKTMGDAVLEAKTRKILVPIEILVERPSGKPIYVKGVPQQRMQLERVTLETVGDFAQLYKEIGQGKMHPVPDLAIQVLNIILDLMGLIERAEREDVGATEETGDAEGDSGSADPQAGIGVSPEATGTDSR